MFCGIYHITEIQVRKEWERFEKGCQRFCRQGVIVRRVKGRGEGGERGVRVPGAAQSKVPVAEARVADLLMILAKPTSAILATPPRPSRMLWLFRSRWMICKQQAMISGMPSTVMISCKVISV